MTPAWGIKACHRLEQQLLDDCTFGAGSRSMGWPRVDAARVTASAALGKVALRDVNGCLSSLLRTTMGMGTFHKHEAAAKRAARR